MRPVRPFLLALALCLAGASATPEPAWAQAAEPIPDTGLVEFLPAGHVVGDGATVTRLYAVAIGSTGAPVTGLSPRADASAGVVTAWSHLGNGVYAFDYRAPAVAERTPVTVSIKARTAAAGKVERSLVFDVVPPIAGSMTASVTPDRMLLGTDLGADVAFTLVGPPGQPLDGASLALRVSEGEVRALESGAGGAFTARYAPKAVNFPHLALITAADSRQPHVATAHAVVRLTGRVDYPVTAAAGAQVSMTIGDRSFGPVTAGKDGRALVPIEVPPGVQKATVTIAPAGVAATSAEIDLRIPPSRRVALFPTAAAFPIDHGAKLTLRALVRTPHGDADAAAKVVFEVSRGTVGVPRHVGDGVYEVEYAPAAEAGRVDVTVKIDGEADQADALSFDLRRALPGRLVLTADPPVLAAGATALSVVASPQTADGMPMPGAKVTFVGGGAKIDGSPESGSDGATRARFLTNPAGPVEILVRPDVPASGNPMRHLVLIPGRDRLANDGLSGTPVVVVATDAWGQPVAGVPVSLDVVGADGQITAAVTTDANGTGLVLFTAGRKAGVAGIRARSGNFHGAAAVLQVPAVVPPFGLPRLGGSEDVSIASMWASGTGLLRVEHGGDVSAGWGIAGAPATAPTTPAPTPTAPAPVPVTPPTPAPEELPGAEEPWLRARVGYVVASYRYQQSPNGDGGPLIDQVFAVGGAIGGKNATPMGFEVDARAWMPFLPYLGAQVHYRAAFYGVTASIFGDQVARDTLHDLRVGALGRYFIDAGSARLHAGGRVGFHLDDVVYYSEERDGDVISGYRYDTLVVPSLGLGAEIGADVGPIYALVGFDHRLAYGSGPYGWSGDATVGFDVGEHLTFDLGAEMLLRRIDLVGSGSGEILGTVSDGAWSARAGIGVAF